MFTGTPAVGDLLGWNTAGYFAVTTTAGEEVLRVTALDTNGENSLDAELLV
jgi:hypothetical protein